LSAEESSKASHASTTKSKEQSVSNESRTLKQAASDQEQWIWEIDKDAFRIPDFGGMLFPLNHDDEEPPATSQRRKNRQRSGTSSCDISKDEATLAGSRESSVFSGLEALLGESNEHARRVSSAEARQQTKDDSEAFSFPVLAIPSFLGEMAVTGESNEPSRRVSAKGRPPDNNEALSETLKGSDTFSFPMLPITSFIEEFLETTDSEDSDNFVDVDQTGIVPRVQERAASTINKEGGVASDAQATAKVERNSTIKRRQDVRHCKSGKYSLEAVTGTWRQQPGVRPGIASPAYSDEHGEGPKNQFNGQDDLFDESWNEVIVQPTQNRSTRTRTQPTSLTVKPIPNDLRRLATRASSPPRFHRHSDHESEDCQLSSPAIVPANVHEPLSFHNKDHRERGGRPIPYHLHKKVSAPEQPKVVKGTVRIKDDLNMMRQSYLASKSVDSRSVNTTESIARSAPQNSCDCVVAAQRHQYPLFDDDSEEESDDGDGGDGYDDDAEQTNNWIDATNDKKQPIDPPAWRPFMFDDQVAATAEEAREPVAASHHLYTEERECVSSQQSSRAVGSFRTKATAAAAPVATTGRNGRTGDAPMQDLDIDDTQEPSYRSIVL
jgi:hypothetical protein